MSPNSKHVFTNIYFDQIPLRSNEKAGLPNYFDY